MNLEEIYKLAETECKYLKDSGRIKIYVSSLMNDLKVSAVFDRFQAEIDKKNINASVIQTGPFGYYDLEPVVMIEKPALGNVKVSENPSSNNNFTLNITVDDIETVGAFYYEFLISSRNYEEHNPIVIENNADQLGKKRLMSIINQFNLPIDCWFINIMVN